MPAAYASDMSGLPEAEASLHNAMGQVGHGCMSAMKTGDQLQGLCHAGQG